MTKPRAFNKRAALAESTGNNNFSERSIYDPTTISPPSSVITSPYQHHLAHQFNYYQPEHNHFNHQLNLFVDSSVLQTGNNHNSALASPQTSVIDMNVDDIHHQPLSPRVTKRRRNRETPPRPLNSFMIYRREYQKRIKEENPNILLSELSRISKCAADRWANESQQIKQLYAEKAKAEKEKHMKLYPNYVYCPRRPSRTKPRKKSTSSTSSANVSGSESSNEKMSLNFLLNNESNAFRHYTKV